MRPPLYAINARRLLEARRNGYMPDDAVSVALFHADDLCKYPSIVVKPDMSVKALDWSMLVNLEVWLWANATVPLERVVDLVIAVAKVSPRELVLRFEERPGVVHDIDVGSGYHHNGNPAAGIAPEHSFFWLPLNLALSKVGMNLKHALNRAHHGTPGP